VAWWAAVLTLTGLCLFFRRHGLWTLYFVSGAAGTAVLGALVVHRPPIEDALRLAVAWGVYAALGGPRWLSPFFDTGTFLMPVPGGWVSFQLDLECLGILELLVYTGLVCFYPLLSLREKLSRLAWGIPAVVGLNLARTVLVIALIYWAGLDATRLAHTVLGRMFFFFAVMGVYWHAFTRSTVTAYAGLGGKRAARPGKGMTA